jgi:hypothetical protein
MGLVLVAVAGGCTNSDPFNPTSHTVTFVFETTGTSPSATAWECILVDAFGGMVVVPTGPLTTDTLQGNSIRVLEDNQPPPVSFTGRDCEELGVSDRLDRTFVLPAGTYMIEHLNMFNFTLYDAETKGFFFCFDSYDLATALGQQLFIKVGADQPNTIRIILDIGALETDIQSFTCPNIQDYIEVAL